MFALLFPLSLIPYLGVFSPYCTVNVHPLSGTLLTTTTTSLRRVLSASLAGGYNSIIIIINNIVQSASTSTAMSTSTCSSSHCINILEHVYFMETRAAYLRVRSKSLEINARISRFNAYYVERTSLSSLLLSMLLLLLLLVFVFVLLPLPWLPSLPLSSIHN